VSWISIPFRDHAELRDRRHRLGVDRRLFRAFHSSPDSIPTCRHGWAKCIRKYATPYAALIVQRIVSPCWCCLNFAGAGVQETFQKLLSLAVVLQSRSVRLYVRRAGEVR
jgi:hypothetical protein